MNWLWGFPLQWQFQQSQPPFHRAKQPLPKINLAVAISSCYSACSSTSLAKRVLHVLCVLDTIVCVFRPLHPCVPIVFPNFTLLECCLRWALSELRLCCQCTILLSNKLENQFSKKEMEMCETSEDYWIAHRQSWRLQQSTFDFCCHCPYSNC